MNSLQPTNGYTEARLPLRLTCSKNEYDEDALVNYVDLVDDEFKADLDNHGINGAGVPMHKVTLPVASEMAESFKVGQEYDVEVIIRIPDQAFTPFHPLTA